MTRAAFGAGQSAQSHNADVPPEASLVPNRALNCINELGFAPCFVGAYRWRPYGEALCNAQYLTALAKDFGAGLWPDLMARPRTRHRRCGPMDSAKARNNLQAALPLAWAASIITPESAS